jgi:tRNA pseudouridine55 synthase
MTAPEGLLVVDKPAGMTSHDVVARVRRLAGTRRVGHAGTLDPMATGVLVLGLGPATRLLGQLSLTDKEYAATIRLGVATSTGDADGEVVGTADPTGVTDEALTATTAQLTGEIDQVPPAVSAIKVGGERAYQRARRGEDVEIPVRRVTVSAFDLSDRRGTDLDVRVICSTGTYVRALARDLGGLLGVGGHLTALRRTRVGSCALDAAHSLDQLGCEVKAGGSLDHVVEPLAAAVAGNFSRRDVDADDARRVAHGGRLPAVGLGTGPVGIFGPGGELLSLAEERDGETRPLAVFA